jgi:hypothetical protein
MDLPICAIIRASEDIGHFILPNALGIIANLEPFGWVGIVR